jgi:hypothetical protein
METIFTKHVKVVDVTNAQMSNNKIIPIITDASVGGSFLSWSIIYLSGQSNYFNRENNQWLPLIANPVTKDKNAHNYKANFSSQLDDLCTLVDTLKNTDSKYPHLLYFHEESPQNPSVAVDFLLSNSDKSVILSMDKNYPLYMSNMSRREGGVLSFTEPKHFLYDDDEIFDDFINCYFSDSKEFFDLNNVWDKREFIALNYDIAKSNMKPITAFISKFEEDQNYFRLNCFDLFCTFETSVYNLFKYLNLEIIDDRYTKWLSVYHKWNKNHYKRLRFIWYIDEIVDDILYNRPRNLLDFELDLLQEAIIQQKLIKNYNLNFKNWQLDKFTNTQQLHKLLEPNVHD